jgi:hypothetical protein
MTRQHYGDHIRRTQSHWRQENGGEPQKPRPGLVPFEKYKKQEVAKAPPVVIASTWHWRTAREGCNAASGSFYRIPLNGRRG